MLGTIPDDLRWVLDGGPGGTQTTNLKRARLPVLACVSAAIFYYGRYYVRGPPDGSTPRPRRGMTRGRGHRPSSWADAYLGASSGLLLRFYPSPTARCRCASASLVCRGCQRQAESSLQLQRCTHRAVAGSRIATRVVTTQLLHNTTSWAALGSPTHYTQHMFAATKVPGDATSIRVSPASASNPMDVVAARPSGSTFPQTCEAKRRQASRRFHGHRPASTGATVPSVVARRGGLLRHRRAHALLRLDDPRPSPPVTLGIVATRVGSCPC